MVRVTEDLSQYRFHFVPPVWAFPQPQKHYNMENIGLSSISFKLVFVSVQKEGWLHGQMVWVQGSKLPSDPLLPAVILHFFCKPIHLIELPIYIDVVVGIPQVLMVK